MQRSRRIWPVLAVSLCSFACRTAADAAGWPTYRGDAARSGYTAQRLPQKLALRWSYRSKQTPRPAWPSSSRIEFDLAFQPIVIGRTVIFGSSADDRIVALDLDTGRTRWTFFAEGPIRFAPAGWRDRIFAASDDGRLYALSVADGRLLWLHRGGPDERKCLGNDRLISRWPARGGPVVAAAVVYYAAGIWPSDGVYLHALDPQSGNVLWTNDRSGSMRMPQPHGGAEAVSGVPPQGYLLASSRMLFAPTGRAVPAAFDRADGKFLYYRLQENGQRGGTWAMLTDSFLFNAGCVFQQETGATVADYPRGVWATGGDRLVQAGGDTVATFAWRDMEKRDRKGKMVRYRGLEKVAETKIGPRACEVVLAADEAVCGQADAVSVADLVAGKVRWSYKVEGDALGLAVGANHLVVSTDKGILYCFGNAASPAKQEPSVAASSQRSASVAADEIDYGRAAEEILARSDVRDGFCIDLGAESGRLAEELAKRSRLQIYAVESDAAKVAAGRSRLDALGLYGVRVTVHHADPARLVNPRYFANLVVSSQSLLGAGQVNQEAVDHVLRPFGGVACLGKPGQLRVQRRGPLADVGEWTHQNACPANTICSGDRRVKGPLSILWYRDVDFEITNRHGQGPAPLASRGFLIAEGLDGVCALDAYNGRTLWTYWIDGVLKDYNGIHHDVAVGDTGSNICLGDNSVYVAVADRCLRLDLATGRKLAEFATPAGPSEKNRDWGYLAYADGLLYGSIANSEHTVSPRYRECRLRSESVALFAMDANSGQIRWQYRPKDSLRHNAITIAGGRLFLVDRPISMADRIANPKPNGRHRPVLNPGEHPGGDLLALDAATGKVLWRQGEDVFGTQLAVSPAHNLLLMYYQGVTHDFFRLPSELPGRIAAIDVATGRRVWDRPANYKTRPLINGDTIYAEGGAWDVRSGEPRPFPFKRSHGCGQITAGEKLFVFRSATLGYLDLTRNAGVENFGGMRPGCWFNAIPAGGLVLVPEGSAKCVCSYQMQAWLALEPSEGR